MQTFLQVAVVGLLAVIFTNLLRKNNAEIAVILSLAACFLIGICLIQLAKPLVEFMQRLQGLSGLDQGLLEPLLKTIGIGFLTQISSNVCADAGEKAIAKLIEVSGGVLSLYVALPLLEAVLEMMESIGGGI